MSHDHSRARSARTSTPGGSAAVVAENLTLAYGPAAVFRSLSLALPAGGTTALVGPNGSGKSTLLHAVAGLLRPAHGALTVLGVAPAQACRRVAYVLQASKVNGHLPVPVREVVAMGRYAQRGAFGRLRRRDRAAIDAALDRLALVDLADRHLGELSGGQRQRVFVAQGLVQEADLLLLDEPATGLDIVSTARIGEAVADERRAGRTVVMSTHDLTEAADADHLVLLAGRVVAAGPAGQVLTSEHLSAAYGGRLVRLDDGVVLVDDAPHHPPFSTQ